MTDNPSAWTDARVESLKTMWQEGFSASQIATRLGHVTRNAVIGKVHRLKLTLRAPERQRFPGKRPRTRTKRRTFRYQGNPAVRALFDAEPFAPQSEPNIPPALRKALVDLEPNDCRYPIGDPKDKDFGFCGCTRMSGVPYCEGHARVAFRKETPHQHIQAAKIPAIGVKFHDNANEFLAKENA